MSEHPSTPALPVAPPPRRRKPPPPATDLRVVNGTEAHRFCGLSKSSWHRLRAADLTPRPIRLPGSSRPWWRIRDLERWLAGLPSKKH